MNDTTQKAVRIAGGIALAAVLGSLLVKKAKRMDHCPSCGCHHDGETCPKCGCMHKGSFIFGNHCGHKHDHREKLEEIKKMLEKRLEKINAKIQRMV